MLKISTAPHINSPQDTRSIMLDVIIALLPALAAALLIFGLGALIVVLTAVAGCVAFEYLTCRYVLKTAPTTGNLSVVGCFVAVVIAKMAFGGLGKNVFNPALVGRVFLFISFPVQMTSWPKPDFLNFLNADAETGATTLGILKHIDAESSATKLTGSLSELPDYWQMFVGYTGGCIGEVSALALLLGFAWLLWRRIITWHIPFYYVATVFIFTSIIWLHTGNIQVEPITQLLSGGLLLGAIFMATDYVTTPMSRKGQIVFAVGCGILTVIIRRWSAYPEGVSFAILIMNAFVPLIDYFTVPRVFGTGRK